MSGTLQDFASAVENVVSINRDAEQGFRGAADAVKDPALKTMFEQLSTQRGAFAAELQNAVKSLGFEPTNPSGVGGVVHSVWMTIKGALTGHDAHGILAETERGEDWSVKTYREALATSLPAALRPIIEQQYGQVQAAHDRIKAMRDSLAKKEDRVPAAPVGS